MNAAGWIVYRAADEGVYVLGHTGGFFIAGFETRDDALIWLRGYLLQDLAQQRQERLERDRILAAMPVQGRPA